MRMKQFGLFMLKTKQNVWFGRVSKPIQNGSENGPDIALITLHVGNVAQKTQNKTLNHMLAICAPLHLHSLVMLRPHVSALSSLLALIANEKPHARRVCVCVCLRRVLLHIVQYEWRARCRVAVVVGVDLKSNRFGAAWAPMTDTHTHTHTDTSTTATKQPPGQPQWPAAT